jgi:glycosyltransferase involved in cell wall biosynthesis
MQRFVVSLAAEQIRHRLNVRVIVLYDDLRLPHLLSAKKIPFTAIGRSRPSLDAVITFIQTLRRYAPDIVHLHAGLLWIEITGWVFKKAPWIYHAHSYPDAEKTVKSRIVEYWLDRLCNARIAVSQSVAKSVGHGSVTPGRDFIIHNGIDITEELKTHKITRSNSYVFGFASRIVLDKGLNAFVKVASNILELQPNAHFLIAGEGQGFPSFKDALESEGISQHVTFCGHLEEMTSFWSAIDVYLFVAPRDTFGLTLLEAMAHQVPVSAYRTGMGSDEMLIDDLTALVTDYGNAERMAQCALALASDSKLRDRITQDAFRTVCEQFTMDTCAKRIAEVYSIVCRSVF